MRLVRGVGINDMGGSRCPKKIAEKWRDVIRRTDQRDTNMQFYEMYKDCTLDPRWYRLSAFHDWIQEWDWEGKILDKDILVPGNKLYGPDTCMMVSPSVSSFFTTGDSSNPYPQGVFDASKKSATKPYGAVCKFDRKQMCGGFHATIEEAQETFKEMKISCLVKLIERETDPRVKSVLENLYETKDSPEIPWW